MSTRRAGPLLSVLILLGWSEPAPARDPDCPELYNHQFEATLEEIDRSFEAQAFSRARDMIDAAYPRVPCLIEIVPTALLARFARQRAWSRALDIDLDEAERWARLAHALEPNAGWPDYVPEHHPSRKILEEATATEITALAGQGLRAIEGGATFLDGVLLTRPEAEPQTPHLLQVGDATGTMLISTWQDGLAFPEVLLGPPVPIEGELPAWYGKPPGSVKGPRPVRKRRLESAAGLGLAAGSLLGSAWLARDVYLDHPTDGLRTTVNGATVASAAVGTTALAVFGVALTTQR